LERIGLREGACQRSLTHAARPDDDDELSHV
jgi:hypothetical protein